MTSGLHFYFYNITWLSNKFEFFQWMLLNIKSTKWLKNWTFERCYALVNFNNFIWNSIKLKLNRVNQILFLDSMIHWSIYACIQGKNWLKSLGLVVLAALISWPLGSRHSSCSHHCCQFLNFQKPIVIFKL